MKRSEKFNRVKDGYHTPVPYQGADDATLAELAGLEKGARRSLVLDNGVTVNGFRLSRYGAFWGDSEPTEDEWRGALDIIFDIHEGIQWILGDLVAYGLAVGYGKKGAAVEELAERYDYSPTTLNIYASVCRAYRDENFRRLKNLSFSHYQEAMKVADEKARTDILLKASEDQWSTRALRAFLDYDPTALPDARPQSVQRMDIIFAKNRKKYDKIVPKAKKEGKEATEQLSQMIDEEVAYLLAMKTMLGGD